MGSWGNQFLCLNYCHLGAKQLLSQKQLADFQERLANFQDIPSVKKKDKAPRACQWNANILLYAENSTVNPKGMKRPLSWA